VRIFGDGLIRRAGEIHLSSPAAQNPGNGKRAEGCSDHARAGDGVVSAGDGDRRTPRPTGRAGDRLERVHVAETTGFHECEQGNGVARAIHRNARGRSLACGRYLGGGGPRSAPRG
jgi:hypothetical protein